MKLTKLEVFISSGSKGRGRRESLEYELFSSETKLKDRLRYLSKKQELSIVIRDLCYFSLTYCVREISLIHYLWLLPKAKKPKCIQRPKNVESCLRLAASKGVSKATCADTLSAAGVFKGADGLERLAEADDFWEQQPYGTRLYFGDGVSDYLHRGVLRTAIKLLEKLDSPNDKKF
jgi:hypothetical protein